MATVAAIGIALDKFGTMVQQHKIDLYREAYEIYYSPIRSKAVVSGTSKYGNKWCYTLKDWFDLFYKAFSNPDKTNTQLDNYQYEGLLKEQNLTSDDFTTRKVEQEGKVMLKYSTKITP